MVAILHELPDVNRISISEALDLAKQRFGASAIVSMEVTIGPHGGLARCYVGTSGPDSHAWRYLGEGSTWAEAFRDAAGRR